MKPMSTTLNLRAKPGLAVAMLAMALLSGCASMSEKECLNVDWTDKGQRDGRSGALPDLVESHAKACAKVGVQPDVTAWQDGWSRGIRSYCRPQRGWQQGLRGEFYNGVCADQPDGDEFERSYEAAKRIHEIGQRIDRNYVEMQRLERALADAKTDEERKTLRALLRALDIEQFRLRSQQQTQMLMAPRP